jgi:hypothetical protein
MGDRERVRDVKIASCKRKIIIEVQELSMPKKVE